MNVHAQQNIRNKTGMEHKESDAETKIEIFCVQFDQLTTADIRSKKDVTAL